MFNTTGCSKEWVSYGKLDLGLQNNQAMGWTTLSSTDMKVMWQSGINRPLGDGSYHPFLVTHSAAGPLAFDSTASTSEHPTWVKTSMEPEKNNEFDKGSPIPRVFLVYLSCNDAVVLLRIPSIPSQSVVELTKLGS